MFYSYEIAGKKIDDYNGEVSGISSDFHHYEKSFGEAEIYYKSKDGNVVEVICESVLGERHARKEVQTFLDNLMLS